MKPGLYAPGFSLYKRRHVHDDHHKTDNDTDPYAGRSCRAGGLSRHRTLALRKRGAGPFHDHRTSRFRLNFKET